MCKTVLRQWLLEIFKGTPPLPPWLRACYTHAEETDDDHIDHIRPLARQGNESAEGKKFLRGEKYTTMS